MLGDFEVDNHVIWIYLFYFSYYFKNFII